MPTLTAAKAYIAFIGALASTLLGVFAADSTIGKILTVLAVVGTAFGTYAVPNKPKAPGRRHAA